ncbi:hypothetical protein Q8W71_12640 [Methylobacterium sp. NEAU 140]|uniref:hypothetical protein n=1 Tax=Methylobacterium sp. NEAU 140 TaxID=3064945 RepID=UPI002735D897|nr:hypothetical protein [Methylobacterium sp. NEAU 140]MDP4023478.1 hypothetical protein [Methylobacterium sp. NEAU 140]
MNESRSLRTRTVRALGAAILSGGLILASGAAHAQFAFEDDILPPRVVAWRLAERGFTGLSRPRFDGRTYVVEAVAPNGLPVRLFVDPAAGAIVARQPLGRPETYARLERPPGRSAPGYGWTEEDFTPRRAAEPEAAAPQRPLRRPGAEAVRPPEANPYGVNPDAGARPEPARKVARTGPVRPPEAKPALRTAPEAPAPKLEAARPAPKPEAPAAAAPGDAKAEGKLSDSKPVAQAAPAAAPAKTWTDPPAEGRRPVRVIGGATVVPGTSDKDAGPAQ